MGWNSKKWWIVTFKLWFSSSDIITIYKGEYKNGKKFGKWEIKANSNKPYQKFRPTYELYLILSFGGLYDMDGRK